MQAEIYNFLHVRSIIVRLIEQSNPVNVLDPHSDLHLIKPQCQDREPHICVQLLLHRLFQSDSLRKFGPKFADLLGHVRHATREVFDFVVEYVVAVECELLVVLLC